jgi:pimeloyl-ACP methyl ester carboxylesterase
VPGARDPRLKDTALLASGLNNNWDFVDGDYTLLTIPSAGHFVQQDAAELVTQTIRSWLLRSER